MLRQKSVNKLRKFIIPDVNAFDVFNGIKDKKIDVGSNGTKKLANHAPQSSIFISIASLLDIVNETYLQILSDQILSDGKRFRYSKSASDKYIEKAAAKVETCI